MSFDLTNKNISETFQNLLQKTGSEGHLYDLVGNQVRDLTIDGTLTANTYITSESIVNTSSGSTAFGNTSDDIHQFTGDILVAGDISASGDFYIGDDIFMGSPGAPSHTIARHGGAGLQIKSGSTQVIGIPMSTVPRVGIGLPATYSPTNTLEVKGDISSSGFISTLSHITASGNISSSGNLIGSALVAHGQIQTHDGRIYHQGDIGLTI